MKGLNLTFTDLAAYIFFLIIGFLQPANLYSQPYLPMPVDCTKTAYYRMMQKPVFDSIQINEMESLNGLELEGPGNIGLENKIVKSGDYAVRIQVPTRTANDVPPPEKRRYNGSVFKINVGGSDWSEYNRLSVWVYPILEGWLTVDFRLKLYNDGKIKVPGYEYPVYNSVLLKNKQWNHVVWELADLPRDKVTGINIQVRRQGNEQEASNQLIYIVDDLAIEKVNQDHFKGWDVASGEIAYSHSGYQINSRKIAIVGDAKATSFKIINNSSGQVAYEGAVNFVKSRIGEFSVMDFSGLTEEGTYSLYVNDLKTKPFKIGENVWESSIWKSINFFYCERCGINIPGIHRNCHRDWQLTNGEKSIICNGGWHDAGDLSQGITNTAEAVYAFLSLADKFRTNNVAHELSGRLIEEAEWGLDWVLKTSFRDGYRQAWGTMGLWTDGIIGNNDDIEAKAHPYPLANLYAAISEAAAARILKKDNPDKAGFAAEMAKEDFNFAIDKIKDEGNDITLTTASLVADAASEIFMLTGNRDYAEIAFKYADVILKSQQREFIPELDYPITGFFYTNITDKRMVHQVHGGQEEDPVLALAKLCRLFPGHKDWIKWYSSIVIYSEYFQKQMSALTSPYLFLPNSLYSLGEVSDYPRDKQDKVREQISSGFNVGGNYFVRMFPVNPEKTWRGNYTTVLSQTKALSKASQVRKNPGLVKLCAEQLHWIVGLNPFAQSTMYGEGYNYPSLYSPMCGDIVGALPVGVKSLGNEDIPYWAHHCFANYKEVWVHPVTRWLWILEDINGFCHINGKFIGLSASSVSMKESTTGNTINIQPNYSSGTFNARVPFGDYTVVAKGFKKKITCMPGEKLDLNIVKELISINKIEWNDGKQNVNFTVNISGSGKHQLILHAENLQTEKKIDILLKEETSENLPISATIISKKEPWVLVIIPDNEFSMRKEVYGMQFRQ